MTEEWDLSIVIKNAEFFRKKSAFINITKEVKNINDIDEKLKMIIQQSIIK